MQIIGRGLIARTLSARFIGHDDTIAFATGVGDSGCSDPEVYRRERELLEKILQHCRKNDERLLYFSTATRVHGKLDGPRDESTPLAPCTMYGQHKCESESLVRSFACRHMIVRLANIVGSQQNPRQLVPHLIQQILDDRAVVHRRATRDLLGAEKLGELIDELLGNVGDHETVVVASGISLPVTEIVQYLQETLGIRSNTVLVDEGDRQEFRIGRLHELAPQSSNFSAGYPCRVLNEYAPRLAVQLRGTCVR